MPGTERKDGSSEEPLPLMAHARELIEQSRREIKGAQEALDRSRECMARLKAVGRRHRAEKVSNRVARLRAVPK